MGAEWNLSCMDKPPVIVYCHSQTGSRIEGLFLLEYCAQRSINLLVFDFAGCGQSQGEYVSLGWFEHIDLGLILCDLRARFPINSICLWGRSMGAVTSILYAEKFPKEIKTMVLDSPFSNLKEMLIQIGQNKANMPRILISLALGILGSSIEERLKVDLLTLEPGKVAQNCNVPAIFIVAKDDEILPPKSVLDIYEKYKCSKKGIINCPEGGHASERDQDVVEQAFGFVLDELSKEHYQNVMRERLSHQLGQRQRKTSQLGMDDPFLNSKMSNRAFNDPPRHLSRINSQNTLPQNDDSNLYSQYFKNQQVSANVMNTRRHETNHVYSPKEYSCPQNQFNNSPYFYSLYGSPTNIQSPETPENRKVGRSTSRNILPDLSQGLRTQVVPGPKRNLTECGSMRNLIMQAPAQNGGKENNSSIHSLGKMHTNMQLREIDNRKASMTQYLHKDQGHSFMRGSPSEAGITCNSISKAPVARLGGSPSRRAANPTFFNPEIARTARNLRTLAHGSPLSP